jgi:hypothetical protein
MSERVAAQKKTSPTPPVANQASSPLLHQRPFTDELSESVGSNSNISKESAGIQPKTIRRSLNWQNISVEAPSGSEGRSLPGGIQRQQEEPGAVNGSRVSADTTQKSALELSNSTISTEAPAQKPSIARAPFNGRNIPVEAPPQSAASSTYPGGIQRLETSGVKEQEESTKSLQMQPQGAIQAKSSEGEPQEKEEQNQELVQTKLTVGAPGDKYEQEADSMATKVMTMPDSAIQQPIQRQTREDTEAVQMQPLVNSISPLVQRSSGKEEEVQMKSGLQQASDGSSQASSSIESRLASSKGGGSALPKDVLRFMEPRFGADFSSVRVHTDSNAVQMNKELGAQAFAHGNDIYYGSGKGPGNNDLTAHELTHVVQQTGGAVQRQSTDGVLARRESPALQMRSQLRTSSLSRLMIQRAITTSGGEWDTDQYDLVQDVPAPTIRGLDIKLKFTPGSNVDAELIGLTQSVQAFVNNAPKLTPAAATRAIPAKDAIGINTGKGETDEGTAIDQSESNRNPLYAVEGALAGDTNLADTLPVAGDATKANTWGKHGFRYKDKGGVFNTQSALLIDTPRRPNAAKDSRHIFETTALAIKGSQAGTYYGSVRWGWRTDSKGNFTKIPLEKVSDGVPSSTFMKAAEIWNAAKTSTGANTVGLPVVDVKITTAPITGVYPAGFVGPPLQIPAGARVQIIRNATPPSTNGRIKVVDGVFTGNTLEVTPTDMANLRDERA